MGPTRGKLGLALILGSAAAYGAMPILAKVAYARGVAPATLLAYRFLLAALLFAVLARRGPRPPLRARLTLWSLGAVFVGNSIAYFTALRTAPAAVVALVLYIYPLLVTLLSAGLGLEPLTTRSLVATALAFAGTALTAGPMERGAASPGVALALVAALGYATYIVLGSRFARGIASDEAARHVAETCAAAFVVLAAARGELAAPASAAAWGAIVAIAVVCTVFALRAFLAGLARVGPSRAAVASSFEVVVTISLAVILLGERVAPRQWLGATLILGGVAFGSLGRRPRA